MPSQIHNNFLLWLREKLLREPLHFDNGAHSISSTFEQVHDIIIFEQREYNSKEKKNERVWGTKEKGEGVYK